jgi:hypothetical protein
MCVDITSYVKVAMQPLNEASLAMEPGAPSLACVISAISLTSPDSPLPVRCLCLDQDQINLHSLQTAVVHLFSKSHSQTDSNISLSIQTRFPHIELALLDHNFGS